MAVGVTPGSDATASRSPAASYMRTSLKGPRTRMLWVLRLASCLASAGLWDPSAVTTLGRAATEVTILIASFHACCSWRLAVFPMAAMPASARSSTSLVATPDAQSRLRTGKAVATRTTMEVRSPTRVAPGTFPGFLGEPWGEGSFARDSRFMRITSFHGDWGSLRGRTRRLSSSWRPDTGGSIVRMDHFWPPEYLARFIRRLEGL